MEHNFSKMVEINGLLNNLQGVVQEFDRLRDYAYSVSDCESQRLKCNKVAKMLNIKLMQLQNALRYQMIEYQHVMDV